MEYDGKSLSFYNNVIYGLNTSSTAYFLNNTCFYWTFDQTRHFCYFATDDADGSLCLYISDGARNDTQANTICGQVTVNEAEKSILFTFDRKKAEFPPIKIPPSSRPSGLWTRKTEMYCGFRLL